MTEAVLVEDLIAAGALRVEDGNHGEYRPRPEEFVATGVQFIRAADLDSGRINFEGAGTIDDIAMARIRKGIGAPGDVLLSHKGTVGKVAQAPLDSPPFVCSPQTTFWRSLKPGVLDARFLRFALESPMFVAQLEALKGESDMAPYVSLTQQRRLKIPLPGVSVQCAIAEVLGALDDKIAANAKVADTAVELARATYLRYSRSAERMAPLGQLAALNYGKALPAQKRAPGAVPVYGSGGITGYHNTPLVDGPGVIVGRKGSVGEVYWSADAFYPIDTTYFVTPRAAVPLAYLYFAIEQQRFGELNSDSAVPGLNRDEAYRALIPFPSGDSLSVFDSTVLPLMQCLYQVRAESAALAQTRDALLPALMSGKLRVRDAERIAEDPFTAVERLATAE